MVNIENVLKHDALLPHPTVFENTLGGALGSYEIWLESDLETHCHDHLINTPQDRLTFTCKKFSLTHECMGTSMCIAKGIIVNVREYDMVEGEMLGEKELRVKSKSVAGTNLGLSLTCMLTHGHST